MSAKQRFLAVALLAGALVAPVVAAAAGGDPERATVLTATDAAAKVAAFTGAPGKVSDLAVKGPIDGAVNRFYQVRGGGVSANVDAHTGDVLSLILPTTSTVAAAPSAASAMATAEQFLYARAVSIDGLTESIRLVAHGETSEYVVEWDRVVRGVVVPDLRVVGVDAATGQVFRYLYFHRAYADPAKPSVDEPAAESAATKLVGVTGLTVDGSSLRVTFSAAGAQRLVWEVSLSAVVDITSSGTEVPGHWLVEVDAATGAASIVTTG